MHNRDRTNKFIMLLFINKLYIWSKFKELLARGKDRLMIMTLTKGLSNLHKMKWRRGSEL